MKILVDTHVQQENGIQQYLHCTRCFREQVRPKIAVGITGLGNIQVWCENHNINIALFKVGEDFGGQEIEI